MLTNSRSFFIVTFIIIISFFIAYECHAISAEELIENASVYDGKEVAFEGEVIGEVMERGDISWLNISDGKAALGVFMDTSILCDIAFAGDYNHNGDIVEVTGVFYKSCPTQGGELAINATEIRKVKNGHKIIRRVDEKKMKAIFPLSVILFFVIILAVVKNRVPIKIENDIPKNL